MGLLPSLGKPVLNASFTGGEDWKVVAERMGFTAPEIRYLDHRTRNPFEAALTHYIQMNPMKVDDLYDILTECGMPVLADILWAIEAMSWRLMYRGLKMARST